jgi:dTDP-4-dehydrorhamnose 3,5-epimerase
VWDVAVDLRRSSCTFLKWHAQELSASNLQALLIPEGFAHGFQALTDDCELLYLHSNAYQPELENGVHPKDPMLSIKWPLPVIELSSKDSNRAWLDLEFKGLNL